MKHYIYLFLLYLYSVQAIAQSPMLWGMAAGGKNNSAIIFSYDVNTGGETIQYNFDSATYVYSWDGLIQANNGYLYGMTTSGGTFGSGTIFSFNTTTGICNVLHHFGSDSDGKAPWGSLFQADNGLLYGVTRYGGSANSGTFFSYDIASGIYVRIHNFIPTINLTDGFEPYGSVFQATNGLLYGMASNSGTGRAGIIFGYDIATGTYSVKHNFNGQDGRRPFGSLVQGNDSLLFGMTSMDGGAGSQGNIFSYNIYNDSVDSIYSFTDYLHGEMPYGSIIKAQNGLFYGMTPFGGLDSVGLIFSYDITTGVKTDIYYFGRNHDGLDGINPFGSPMQASNGLLYGTTQYGGTRDSGIIFSYNILTDSQIVAHSFSGHNDGFFPTGDLLEVDYPTAVYQIKSNESKLKVYPNPANDILQIDLQNISSATIQISVMDISGQLIKKEKISTTDKIELDVSALSAGMYFLVVQQGDESMVRRFVKD